MAGQAQSVGQFRRLLGHLLRHAQQRGVQPQAGLGADDHEAQPVRHAPCGYSIRPLGRGVQRLVDGGGDGAGADGAEPGGPGATSTEMIDEMAAEIHDDYEEGRQAGDGRVRAEVVGDGVGWRSPQPTPKFELRTFHPSQDWSVAECAAPRTRDSLALGAWHESVLTGFESVERDLVVNHEGVLAMLELWSSYEHLQLCTLTGLPQMTAMDLGAVPRRAADALRARRPDAQEEVVPVGRRDLPPRREGRRGGGPDAALGGVDADVQPAAAARWRRRSTRWWSSLSASTRPTCASAEDARLHSEAVDHRTLFVVKMTSRAEAYKFTPSLPTLLKTVLGTIDHFVAMINTVPRIEAEIGKAARRAPSPSPRPTTRSSSRLAKALAEVLEANYECDERMHNARLLALRVPADLRHREEGRSTSTTPATSSARSPPRSKSTRRPSRRSRSGRRPSGLHHVHGGVRRGQGEAGRARRRDDGPPGRGQGRLHRQGQSLCSRYTDIFVRLGVHPMTEEEMVALEQFLSSRRGCCSHAQRRAERGAQVAPLLTEQAVGFFEAEQLQIIGDTWCWRARSSPRSRRATSGSRRSATAPRRS